jgi:asparagine synthase (glutamine-hydrolysing)
MNLSRKDLTSNVDQVSWIFDERATLTQLFYQLCHKWKEYVTIALLGDGGDEVFSGYNKYGRIEWKKYTDYIPYSLHRNFYYYFWKFTKKLRW